MRVVNRKGETLTEYDLTLGYLSKTKVIRKDAKPIDNKTKFAWAKEDYEDVQMYMPYPEKTTAQKIQGLKAKLSATDYKVIKCAECQLLGQEMPYDVVALHAQRQAIRDQINQLEQEE